MLDTLAGWVRSMPPLKGQKSSGAAAAWGFFLGAIGLWIYLRSFVDGLVALAAWVVSVVIVTAVGGDAGFAALGWLPGALVAALYGYYRAETSNANLLKARSGHEMAASASLSQ